MTVCHYCRKRVFGGHGCQERWDHEVRMFEIGFRNWLTTAWGQFAVYLATLQEARDPAWRG